mgnify:CR=1 FL=1
MVKILIKFGNLIIIILILSISSTAFVNSQSYNFRRNIDKIIDTDHLVNYLHDSYKINIILYYDSWADDEDEIDNKISNSEFLEGFQVLADEGLSQVGLGGRGAHLSLFEDGLLFWVARN